ncbi:orotidine-5'-phosphate decarboxylase [Prochlorothrix hollandica]|uniref:Orotidine 5'-phosphate decarboxylase n=1 Tax=Prochlorothrix hollandica PCC 9006 = CALU 1027 TaxID=317619 RepID=A0A0M2PZE5_PROHO|nr:orotidine-5'-phosphate decarboxylase [Prochlorothrix hollandica]KKI99766.1 orotidine 5'-phosphate decarboxylase [Prochlorothrix hollandica PCC 9006 = CALU 1027]
MLFAKSPGDSPDRRIIVPLDVPTLAQAKALVDQLPQVSFWKVGLELFVSGGAPILAELRQRGARIFLDLKFHDIPNTMAGACAAAATYGVDFLTVHASAGRDALTAAQAAATTAAQTAGHPSPHILAVTLLTSLNSRHLAFDLKVSLDPWDYVQQMAMLALDSGVAGVVCSPQEIAAVRQVCPVPFQIVCPGVRPDWATAGDQQRTLTPAAAIAAGADYLVIGRPITQAADPAAAFARICDELN